MNTRKVCGLQANRQKRSTMRRVKTASWIDTIFRISTIQPRLKERVMVKVRQSHSRRLHERELFMTIDSTLGELIFRLLRFRPHGAKNSYFSACQQQTRSNSFGGLNYSIPFKLIQQTGVWKCSCWPSCMLGWIRRYAAQLRGSLQTISWNLTRIVLSIDFSRCRSLYFRKLCRTLKTMTTWHQCAGRHFSTFSDTDPTRLDCQSVACHAVTVTQF